MTLTTVPESKKGSIGTLRARNSKKLAIMHWIGWDRRPRQQTATSARGERTRDAILNPTVKLTLRSEFKITFRDTACDPLLFIYK